LKKLYILLESVRDVVASLMQGYNLSNVYKTVMYSAIYAALYKSLGGCEPLRPLEEKIPLPLLAIARRKLVDEFLNLLEHLNMILSSKKPILIREANLDFIVKQLKNEIERVDYVLMYDCMSMIEFLTISAYLRLKGIKSAFLGSVFLNPIGLTRFMTHQLFGADYRASLLGVAQYIADNLGGIAYAKSSYIDEKVHEVGYLGVDEFVDVMDIEAIADEVLTSTSRGRVLVGSDHGYDVVKSIDSKYIYVVHGFRPESSFKAIPLLPLSRFAFFIVAYRMG